MGTLENIANTLLNQLYLLSKKPTSKKLQSLKLVAHRGITENALALENTLAAFQLAAANKIWGVEFDIRWTKDLVPVVHHDESLERIFQKPDIYIDKVTFSDLRKIEPRIPSLQEVVAQFKGKLHLMIEIKGVIDSKKAQTLHQILSFLQPGNDYHFLSLNTENFNFLSERFPHICLMLVAKLNEAEFVRLAIERRYGALAGHFFTLKTEMINQLHNANIQIGSGFPENMGCLYRDINRDVDFIFTNHALKLSKKIRS